MTAALYLTACSSSGPVAGVAGDRLLPGAASSVDLDGDGALESALIDGNPASLTITDDDTEYRSRERWRFVEACLGDTDRDGLLEVVALVDDAEGRHLGLFAYFGGEYRERLVTSELSPRPLSLTVMPGEGDLVVLTEEAPSDQTGERTTIYRWNGFGFTAIEP